MLNQNSGVKFTPKV